MGKGTYDSAGIAARVFCTVPNRAAIHTNVSLEMFSLKVAASIETPWSVEIIIKLTAVFSRLAPELFFFILAHPVYKM